METKVPMASLVCETFTILLSKLRASALRGSMVAVATPNPRRQDLCKKTLRSILFMPCLLL
jgi:hypothetical protein